MHQVKGAKISRSISTSCTCVKQRGIFRECSFAHFVSKSVRFLGCSFGCSHGVCCSLAVHDPCKRFFVLVWHLPI